MLGRQEGLYLLLLVQVVKVINQVPEWTLHGHMEWAESAARLCHRRGGAEASQGALSYSLFSGPPCLQFVPRCPGGACPHRAHCPITSCCSRVPWQTCWLPALCPAPTPLDRDQLLHKGGSPRDRAAPHSVPLTWRTSVAPQAQAPSLSSLPHR